MQEYVPHRKCVGCQKIRPKYQLLRIAKNNEGIFIDEKQRLPGRGAYLCKNEECLHLAMKKKGLERSLKVAIPKEFYDVVERFFAENFKKSAEVSE
ncbi:YlxR family protein [Caldicellulosiruptor changbaiensis]|uniref:YlxR family protein n=1 Tax=Caldicellulosiruptor changbaiensis TaxID=1222016 RepID=A0A3T0D556_9FIRM|nr:YlxR family protein [Caldicellulosiruptor changbaiensis]AZT90187.1 YlxR family protein [Caldicellulosiruptor changbaiensis]